MTIDSARRRLHEIIFEADTPAMTTAGYGGIVPQTAIGKMPASVIMILGYAIFAMPTGIVSVELAGATRRTVSTRARPDYGAGGHEGDARYCRYCGAWL